MEVRKKGKKEENKDLHSTNVNHRHRLTKVLHFLMKREGKEERNSK
jgi:hypothetical protein